VGGLLTAVSQAGGCEQKEQLRIQIDEEHNHAAQKDL
jgi:hypothetical protein